MAVRYYDDALIMKLQKWIPENSNLHVFAPDETAKLFSIGADDKNDKAVTLPFIALSRDTSIELLSNIKQPRSFNGIKILDGKGQNIPLNSLEFNVIPIKLEYQLDIYTKRVDEGDEYLRTFLFKLINNPVITIDIPYNNGLNDGIHIQHIANIRVQSTVSETSGITQRLFSGQFTRWTIRLEIQDAFLFSLPYRKNWILNGVILETANNLLDAEAEVEFNSETDL